MIGHLSGIDSAGHMYFPSSPQIERVILGTSEIIRGIVDKMDNNTTLIIYGDHGMTVNGYHGEMSELERRSILFAHQKTSFPLHQLHDTVLEAFLEMDTAIKILDVPTIVA